MPGAAILLLATACTRPSRPDSLLLITLDTFRADHVSCYGPSPVATPNLDRVAEHGAIIERAWTPIPLTTPAHASILTGLYPPSHGVRSNARFRLPDDVTTLAEILRGRGLRTAAFIGSYTTSRLFGLDQGFETFDDALGHFPDGTRRVERRGDEVANRAREWIRKNAGQPFFIWVHFNDAHTPYEPPGEFAGRFPQDPYSGEVAFTDLQVGRLLSSLQESGAVPRTVVAIIGDHGEGLRDHGESEHGFLLYEESLRIPFLIAAPGRIAPGTRIREVASAIDLLPTVLRLLGAPVPAGVQGIDLLEKGKPRGEGIYAETLYPSEEFAWSPLYAYRSEDAKVIDAPRPELYDLSSDPGERRDLSSADRQEAGRMREELRHSARRMIDPNRLARAAGSGEQQGMDAESLRRLESLGYVGGGGNVTAGEAEALPDVGGRNPAEAMDDLRRYESAVDQLNAGKFTEAAAALAALHRSDPGNPAVMLKLAQATQHAGRSAEAEELYRELLRAHPTFYLGTWSFCDFLEKAGRARESRDLWLRLKGLVPGFVGIDWAIARAETAAGLAGDARGRLEAYLEKRPEDFRAWRELGRAKVQLGDRAGALEAFRKALDLEPTDAEALDGAIALLVSTGRRQEAAALIDQLAVRAPEDPLIQRRRTDFAPPP